MPAYDESPSLPAILKRTRDRIVTIRKALDAMSNGGGSDRQERSRQAAKNLEMLVDPKEMRQVRGLVAQSLELDASLQKLAAYCRGYRIPASIDPDRSARLAKAIKAFVSSPVASGSFIGGAGRPPLKPASSSPIPPTAASLQGAVSTTAYAPVVGNSLVEELWHDIGHCKDSETCSRLSVRARWFEPNPGTLRSWRVDGKYLRGVDRRVVFVCESPTKRTLGLTFDVPGVRTQGARCWGGDNAFVTDDFWLVRERYGLGSTWITNVVKCGATASARPVSEEVRACSPFLKRELELIQPAVIALVGKSKTVEMFRESMEQSRPVFTTSPTVIPITHYAYARRPGGRGRMMEIWQPEFEQIRRELDRRGLTKPQWMQLV